MEYKIDLETATDEVEGWLDYQKITPLLRKNFKDSIATLVEGIQLGALSLKDNAFTQTLFEPVGKEGNITTIKYKARIKNSLELEPFKKNTSDGNGLILAVWCCLTSDAMPEIVYQSLDKSDKRFAGAIVIFFLET